MIDETQNISAKSWARAADSINKVGFMDGAADGQKATFQQSFDTGYKQGFVFGVELGIMEAGLRIDSKDAPVDIQLRDPRKINCQICINSSSAEDATINLFNHQKENNDQYLQKLKVCLYR